MKKTSADSKRQYIYIYIYIDISPTHPFIGNDNDDHDHHYHAYDNKTPVNTICTSRTVVRLFVRDQQK